MLTLFPRIRPNPLPPPPPPKLPEDEAPIVTAAEAVLAVQSAEAGASQSSAATEVALAPVLSSVEVAQSLPATATMTDDSNGVAQDLSAVEARSSASELSILVAGFASVGAEPFVVEITDQWTSPQAESPAIGPVVVEPESAPANATAATETTENAKPVTEGGPESAEQPSMTIAPAVPAAPQASDAGGTEQRDPELNAGAALENPLPSTETGSSELWIAGTNIFDELDILHEAAAASVAPAEIALPNELAATEPPPQVAETSVELVHESVPEKQAGGLQPGPDSEQPIAEPEPANVAASAVGEGDELGSIDTSAIEASAAQETVAETPQTEAPETAPSAVEEMAVVVEESRAAEQAVADEIESTQDAPIQNVASLEAPAQESTAEQQPALEQAAELAEPANQATEASALEQAEHVAAVQPAAASRPARPAIPPKPKHAEGRFFELARVPEPEAMDDSGEVEAYASAAAQAHLDAIDDTFIAHAQLLLKGRERGRALDIGTGPGQIVIKLASKLTRWKFIGVDRSAAMIERAREGQANVPEVAGRVEFRVADGNSLDFPDGTFDLVVCNSVLHHMAEPQNLFSEVARVVKSGGAILLRDLRRPARFEYGSHIRKHGKHYSGEMRRLYVASVQAAYTEEELQKMVAESRLRDVRVFVHGKTHIGFERPLAEPAPQKSKSTAAR